MSMTEVSKLYEKMLQEPTNRKSSTGAVKQPTPYGAMGIQDPNLAGTGMTAEESANMAAIDARMAKRQDEPVVAESSRINKLEHDVSELKELMMSLMKTHMEILEKKNG